MDSCSVYLEDTYLQKHSCGHFTYNDCINTMMQYRKDQKALLCSICRGDLNYTERRWVLLKNR